MLVCGITTQLHAIQPNWDELIRPGDTDFPGSGLLQMSVIRLSYLHAIRPIQVVRVIGQVDPGRLARLRTRLADHLRP
jgi:hypothetical protein